MAKPGEVIYDFSALDQDKEFQDFLRWSLKNEVDEVDIEKCLEGSRKFNQRFIKPLSNQRFMGLMIKSRLI